MCDAVARDRALAQAIARDVADLGGRVYYVGGMVRDALMGRPLKDIDLEVYGITPEQLRTVLANYGPVKSQGAFFGVLALAHSGLDIAMPRRELCRGTGHRDFDVSVDPWMSPKEASVRRDFTVNAMMQDVLTGELLDLWGGQRDLAGKVLRHVQGENFVEDPLRVFRGAQFCARFAFELAPETLALCRGIDASTLSRERVFDEMAKALEQAARPSVFFRLLREMDQLSVFFPELAGLIGVPQNPVFHPEGDVWAHTLLVLDAAAQLREQAEQPLFFLLAALCHDLGKQSTTQQDAVTGKITSYEHPEAGVMLSGQFLRRLTSHGKLLDYVGNMVALHMRPNLLAMHRSKRAKTRALFDAAICPNDLILLAQADVTGKLNAPDPAHQAFLRERLADYRAILTKPMVQGADLLAAGLSPGPAFTPLLARARKLHLGGMDKAQVLGQLLKEHGQK